MIFMFECFVMRFGVGIESFAAAFESILIWFVFLCPTQKCIRSHKIPIMFVKS